MADFGTRRGLAQSFNYDQQVADIARQNDQMRQAKLYAENQAKMQAEDFDYNNAMNAWDNTQVKEFAQNKIKELGSFIRENPDYKYNLEKRIVYNNIKKELKDNKPLLEGMQVDANVKAMQAWKDDPKNAPLVDTPEFKRQLSEYDNYLKSGSIDGNSANRKLFKFYPPEEHMDTTPDLIKYANAANYDMEKTEYLSGSTGAKKRWVSDARKGDVAKAALGDAKLGRELRWEYNKYLSEQGEGAQPITLEQYAVTKLNPYFKAVEHDKFGIPTKNKDSDGNGSTKSKMDLFGNLVNTAMSNPNTAVSAIGKGVKNIFTKGQEQFNLAQAGFMKDDGEIIPFTDVTLPSGTLDVSSSYMVYDKNRGVPFLVADITIPLDQAKTILQKNDPVNDPWYNIFIPERYESNSAKEGFSSKEGYSGMTVFVDENGQQMVNMKVSKPVQAGNDQVNAEYDYGAGQGMSGYSDNNEQPNDKPQVGQEVVLPSGKKAVFNGVKWETK